MKLQDTMSSFSVMLSNYVHDWTSSMLDFLWGYLVSVREDLFGSSEGGRIKVYSAVPCHDNDEESCIGVSPSTKDQFRRQFTSHQEEYTDEPPKDFEVKDFSFCNC